MSDHMDLMTTLLDSYESYHTQKENMTWAGATVFVGGAIALVVMGDPPWQKWSYIAYVSFLFLLLATATMGIIFVQWQFRNRHFASDLFLACANVGARWTEKSPPPEELKAVPVDARDKVPLLLPAELANEYQQIAKKRITPVAQYLTLGTMLLWAIAALARVVLTAPPCS